MLSNIVLLFILTQLKLPTWCYALIIIEMVTQFVSYSVQLYSKARSSLL